MTPSRPYMLRALYDWIVDNGLTPYILVDAGHPGVEVPQEHVQEGQIVLNIAPGAVQGLDLGNEEVVFSARFAGVARHLVVPVMGIIAIYARENNRGMVFAPEEESPPPGDDTPEPPSKGSRPSLKVVK
ncbi:MAG TPA: ClpXP protease specificity-enhancing factor [Thiotrichales bacterium]|nr:ClpXP protease specificity-enhancing factor [Thiotrichales bacterium]